MGAWNCSVATQWLGLSRLFAITPIALQVGGDTSHGMELLGPYRGAAIGPKIGCGTDTDTQSEHLDPVPELSRMRTEVDYLLKSDLTTYHQMCAGPVQGTVILAETVTNIRQLPGLEKLQLTPTAADLMAAALGGPIVIVSSSGIRSDAVIVTHSAIKAIPLPGLIYEDVKEQMRRLHEDLIRGKHATYPARNQGLLQLLQWLWDTVVEPVLNELQFHPSTLDVGTTLPRMWWIGTGPLAMAPFHAAGDHSPGSTRNTLSRAISSYTTTIKALSDSRGKKLESLRAPGSKLLLITMPETPRKSPLRGAEKEATLIASEINGTASALILESPTSTEVLEKLKCYQAIHFACHAVPDAMNPANTALLLSKRGVIDQLTVGDISSANTKNARLAYLSACSTAYNYIFDPEDEPIHIAAGFQLAGFSHVLSTSWKSVDAACQEVAVDFYHRLYGSQDNGGHEKVSHAFHHAVRKIRDKIWRQPIIWAAFVHTGA